MHHHFWFIIFLFILITILASLSIIANSVTTDEFDHVPGGLAQLRTGKFNMSPANPPLIRMWLAVPLLFVSPKLYLEPGFEQIDYVHYGMRFMTDNADRYFGYIKLSRIFVFLLIIPLVYLVWQWTKKEFGIEVGVTALFFLLLNPNILAHATLATTDFGLTVFFFATVYFFKKFYEIPSWINAAKVGVTLGLAQCAKFTSLFLYPIILIGIILFCLHHRLHHKQIVHDNVFIYCKKIVLMAMVIILMSILIINLVYCFQLTGTPLYSYQFQHPLLQFLKSVLPTWLPIPLPYFYLSGLDRQIAETGMYRNYLHGVLSSHGWWYYYLVAFVIKNPIPFLICLVLGCYSYFQRTKLKRTDWLLILPPIIVFLAFSISSTKNIGLRFILPVYPFFAILAGQAITLQIPKKKLIVGTLAAWYFVSSLWIAPNFLAYFNELIGGPSQGYKYLLDSNLDWGQDMLRLKRYLDKNQIKEMHLSCFGPVPPQIYGIESLPLPTNPQPGRMGISVNHLFGIELDEPNKFAWLRNYEPSDRVSYSIFIYDIKTTK
ncbi:MAG: glycosyltransferase family 39 protein [bacterium]|nr:glycosyltransferase family 39 protein [bacterium]